MPRIHKTTKIFEDQEMKKVKFFAKKFEESYDTIKERLHTFGCETKVVFKKENGVWKEATEQKSPPKKD